MTAHHINPLAAPPRDPAIADGQIDQAGAFDAIVIPLRTDGGLPIGRKNWLYLESVITHMTRGRVTIDELLPDRWSAAHPHSVREYREQARRNKGDTATP
ncbi:MAG: hypothetical protein KGS49_14155 [Planctomycetes bacterium]|nr:hypothetical protein [Planctomycetota bacterium]